MSTNMFFLHWTPSSRYCRINRLNHLLCPSSTSPTQLSIFRMPSISVKADINCHLWHLLFQVLRMVRSIITHSDTFLLVQLPTSSSVTQRMLQREQSMANGENTSSPDSNFSLSNATACDIPPITSLSEGDTLVLSSNSTVSLLLQAIRSHHASSTKSTPQFLIGSRYVVLNDKTIHLLRGSVGFIPLRMIHMIQYWFMYLSSPHLPKTKSALISLIVLATASFNVLTPLSFTKATRQTIHCCNALALLTYLILSVF